MMNLRTIETGYGLQSEKRLDPSQFTLHRTFENRSDIALQVPGTSEVVDQPSQAETSLARVNKTPAPSLFKEKRLLVPFDFSASSVQLLQWAIRTAESSAAKISVLHVVHPWVPLVSRQEPFYFEPNADRIDTARSLLRSLLQNVCQTAKAVTAHVAVGRPIDEIVRFAGSLKADLILMAPHGHRGLKHRLLSATTERTTRRAPCPVLVVPESMLQRWEVQSGALLADLTRILVLTDFSAGAAAALHCAVDLAQEHRAEVYVLDVSTQRFRRQLTDLGGANNAKVPVTERLAAWISSHLGSTNNVIPRACIGTPSVYAMLLEAALLGADLVVFGPRRYSWAERLRLSGSMDTILRKAPCPVLSLRAETLVPGQ